MYGLIVENLLGYLRTHFHPHRYDEILNSSKLPFNDPPDLFQVRSNQETQNVDTTFNLLIFQKVYPEGVIPRVGKKARYVNSVGFKGFRQDFPPSSSIHLQLSEKEIFEGMGVYFVTFYKKLGYRYLRESILSKVSNNWQNISGRRWPGWGVTFASSY